MTNLLLGPLRRVVGFSTSMRTALGKRKCQIVLCGTVAPSPMQGPGAWWPDLVKSGSGDGVHLELLQADEKRWRDWGECLRVNPAHLVNPFLEKNASAGV